MPRKILLDCDPGHDDALAIFLAAGSPEIDLLAITTVAGNQDLDKVTANARSVAAVAGLDVPIAAGLDRPLVRPKQVAADIHGESGLDGPRPWEPIGELDPRHAVDLIIDTVLAHEPGEVTLVATGPLSNIALAVRKCPRLVEHVRELVLMGGAYGQGNYSPAAEFNIVVDPEAAHIVFAEPWPITMIGLDLTHQALATDAVLDSLRAVDTAAARFSVELLDFFTGSYRDAQGFDAPPVHDPCTIAYLIDPSVMTVRKAPVRVELQGAFTTGMTVTDLRTPAAADCTTQVAQRLDADKFWGLVVDAVRELG